MQPIYLSKELSVLKSKYYQYVEYGERMYNNTYI